jgi:quercetin 2,3-dioxygenase
MAISTPVFHIQRSVERAFFDHGWLKTYHSFSFADYVDRLNLQWGALRVFNDDLVAPGQGFPPHPHHDMEILTYVLSGRLTHEDSMGNRGVVGPGGVQYMSAGTGVRHSEANASGEEPLHFIQMWVLPRSERMTPRYGQHDFSSEDRRGRWLTVASGVEGVSAPISIGQDATFSVAKVEGGELSTTLDPSRLAFFFVADGEVVANGATLTSGDAVRVGGVGSLAIAGAAELLLWNLPDLPPG